MIAVGRQQGNVDKGQLIRGTSDQLAPDGLVSKLKDADLGMRKVLLVVTLLKTKLHPAKRRALLVRETRLIKLIGARACIKLS